MIRDLPALVAPWVPLAALVLIVCLFYSRVLSKSAVASNRVRALRWRIRARLKPGPGYASFPELFSRWGRLAALHHGGHARPGMRRRHRLRARTTRIAVRLGRAQWFRRVYGRLEDQCGTIAAQRSGKTGLLIDRVLDHDGPVITSSSRADIYTASASARSRRGPVEVFNPLGVGGVRSTFSWNLLGACGDEMSAYRMADWLAGATPGYGNVEWFECKATFALGALLMAANVGGYTITDVYWWIHSGAPQACPAIAILRRHGNPQMAQLVHRLLGADRTAGSVRDTMDKTLQFAAMPPLAEAASREGSFDHLGLLEDCGTLYLITSGEGRSLITPLIRALASWLHFEAGLIGSKRRHGRLDPPLLMALDEVSVTCPIALPDMLSDSAGKGILIEWVAHSISQLEERWGKHGAQTIIATSGLLRLLGGIKNPETLELAAQLCGKTEGHDGKEVPVVPVDLLRTLPDWRALVIRTNLRPLVVKFRPYWRRWNYRWPFRNRQVVPVTRHAQPAPAAWLLDVPEDVPAGFSAADPAALRGGGVDAAEPVTHNGHRPQAWIPEQFR